MELRQKPKTRVANTTKSTRRNSNINGTANIVKTTVSNAQKPTLQQLSIQFNQLQQKLDDGMANNARKSVAIDEINKIIKIKSDDFESTILQLKSELDKVRQTNLILIKCMVNMLTKGEVNFQFNSNEFPYQNDAQNQITSLNGNVNAESTNVVREFDLNQILQLPNQMHQLQNESNQMQKSSNLDEVYGKIDDLQNQIQCLNAEIIKVQAVSLSIDEKYIKMNKQLHVMSAKYIDHSAKINLFLMDFRSQNKNIGNIDPTKYVDQQALEFAGLNVMNHKAIEKSTIHNGSTGDDTTADDKFNDNTIEIGNTYPVGSELFCSANDESNHFKWDSSKQPYTRLLKIKIHQSCMLNLNTFLSSFTKTFNYYFGKSIINNVTISKYSIAKGIINGIEVYVQLNVPISYQYLNCIKYPSNWQFFHVSTHHKNKSHQTINAKHK